MESSLQADKRYQVFGSSAKREEWFQEFVQQQSVSVIFIPLEEVPKEYAHFWSPSGWFFYQKKEIQPTSTQKISLFIFSDKIIPTENKTSQALNNI